MQRGKDFSATPKPCSNDRSILETATCSDTLSNSTDRREMVLLLGDLGTIKKKKKASKAFIHSE